MSSSRPNLTPMQQMAQSIGYDYTKLPKDATGIEQNTDGTYSIMVNGKVQKYKADGSFFDAKPVGSDGKADGSDGAKGAGAVSQDDASTVRDAVGKGVGVSAQSVFGNGFSGNTSYDLTTSYMNMNGGFSIDPNKFMGAATGFSLATALAQMIPFGLGAVFGRGAVGAALNGFTKALSFNFDFSNYLNQQSGGTTTTRTSTEQIQEGNQPVDTDGAQAGDRTQQGASKPDETTQPSGDGTKPTDNADKPTEITEQPEDQQSEAQQPTSKKSSNDGYHVSKWTANVTWKKEGGVTKYYIDQDGKKVQVSNYNGKTYTLNGKTYNAKTGKEVTAPKSTDDTKSAQGANSTQGAQTTQDAQTKFSDQKAGIKYTTNVQLGNLQGSGQFTEKQLIAAMNKAKVNFTTKENAEGGKTYTYTTGGKQVKVTFDKGRPSPSRIEPGNGKAYLMKYDHGTGARTSMRSQGIHSTNNYDGLWRYDKDGNVTDSVEGYHIGFDETTDASKWTKVTSSYHVWRGGSPKKVTIPDGIKTGATNYETSEGKWHKYPNSYSFEPKNGKVTYYYDKSGTMYKAVYDGDGTWTYDKKGRSFKAE